VTSCDIESFSAMPARAAFFMAAFMVTITSALNLCAGSGAGRLDRLIAGSHPLFGAIVSRRLPPESKLLGVSGNFHNVAYANPSACVGGQNHNDTTTPEAPASSHTAHRFDIALDR
jgi:hypothetical protein